MVFGDRKLCCATVKSLFINEGKHGGEAIVEAVQLIAEHVKVYDCQLHPDSIEVSNFPVGCLCIGVPITLSIILIINLVLHHLGST